jgi:hypothetical protein
MNKHLTLFFILGSVFSSACCYANELTDPTLPPSNQDTPISSANVKKPMWVLNSTLVSPYQEVAIINGIQLTVGDEINGATILTITHNQVELLANKQPILLTIGK